MDTKQPQQLAVSQKLLRCEEPNGLATATALEPNTLSLLDKNKIKPSRLFKPLSLMMKMNKNKTQLRR